MTIRLNKVTRDLNVGITTVVEFLQKKGYTIEANPNTKITEEQYAYQQCSDSTNPVQMMYAVLTGIAL